MDTPPTAEVDQAGRQAALLAAIEVGIGSVVHALHVPFGGHVLSLNQGFMLARLCARTRRRDLPFICSNVAAALKSLSPAGKKLTPMLAISAQGALFSLGVGVFGTGVAGILVGTLLLSVWAFVQPLAIALLLFGKPLVDALRFFHQRLLQEGLFFGREQLLWVVCAMLAVKFALAAAVVFAAYRLPDRRVEEFQARLLAAGRERRQAGAAVVASAGGSSIGQRLKAAARDLLNPLFLVSLAMTGVFFFYAEAKTATIIWSLLRPVAGGFALFFILRSVSFERGVARLERAGFQRFAHAFRVATRTLREI